MDKNNVFAEMLAAAGMEEPEWSKNETDKEPMKKYIVRIRDGYNGEKFAGNMWEDFDSIHECIMYISQHCKKTSSYEIEQYRTGEIVVYHYFDYDWDKISEKIGDVFDDFKVK